MNKNITNTKGKIDWMITLVPLGIVIALCILFFLLPDQLNPVSHLLLTFLVPAEQAFEKFLHFIPHRKFFFGAK